MQAPSDTELPVCPGCAERAQPGEYCSACGECLRPSRPTGRELAAEVLGGLTSWDHALGRTLRGLARDPGHFASRWLEGDRRRHISPGRLLVWTIALYALGHVLLGLDVLESSGIRLDGDQGGPVAESQTGADSGTSSLALARDVRALAGRWIQPLLLLSLPLLALLLRGLYRSSGRSLADCLALVAYVESARFGVRALLLPLLAVAPGPARLLGVLVSLFLSVWAARTFFGVSAGGALWRELVARMAHLVLTTLVFAAILVPAAFLLRTGPS